MNQQTFGLSLPALRRYRLVAGEQDADLPMLWRMACDQGTRNDVVAMRCRLADSRSRTGTPEFGYRLLLLDLLDDLLGGTEPGVPDGCEL